jgi:hypothetical protein
MYAALLLLIPVHCIPVSAVREAYGVRARDPAQYPHYAEGARVRQCLYIGAELSSLFPNAALMTPEVGALGWTFGGRIIEMVLGSTTEYVLRNSSCPLFLNR